ncbi:MAG: DUF5658 family protein [Fimbriimonadaceae bacterium]
MLRSLFPSRGLALLLAIGLLDLLSTAWLHQRGLIVELNPLMRPLIERSEALFALVKGMTLLAAWFAMRRYYATHGRFIDAACVGGSVVYVVVWLAWMAGAALSG